MEKIRCKSCVGSGKVMGGGMIIKDCDQCDGTGKIYVKEKKEQFEIEKNNKHYKKAIKNIKGLDNKITDQEAEKIFHEELEKINREENKDG